MEFTLAKRIISLITSMVGLAACILASYEAIYVWNYQRVAENLGHGTLQTTYSQAFAYCGSNLGQAAQSRSQSLLQTCHSVGSVGGTTTVVIVFGVVLGILFLAATVISAVSIGIKLTSRGYL